MARPKKQDNSLNMPDDEEVLPINLDHYEDEEDDSEEIDNWHEHQHIDRHIYELDNRDIFLDFKVALLNLEKLPDGRYIRGKLPPRINDKGYAWLMSRLVIIGNKMNILATFDADTVAAHTLQIANSTLIHLAINHELYGIAKSDIRSLNQDFRLVVHSTLSRAIGGKEKEYRIRTPNQVTNPSNEGNVIGGV